MGLALSIPDSYEVLHDVLHKLTEYRSSVQNVSVNVLTKQFMIEVDAAGAPETNITIPILHSRVVEASETATRILNKIKDTGILDRGDTAALYSLIDVRAR